MSARPVSAVFPPSGCAHCGVARHDHFQRWTHAAGWHKWEHPAQEQFKARMFERRRKAVEAREYPPIAWDDPYEGSAMRWSPTDPDKQEKPMSYITVHVYSGDPAEYEDEDETGTIGARDAEQEAMFSDGEELDAARAIVGLLAEGKHFDVRQWLN